MRDADDVGLGLLVNIGIESFCGTFEREHCRLKVGLSPFVPGRDDRGNGVEDGALERALHALAEEVGPE